ncbi:MAG: gliding motility lipoprotein GldH [Bacteroidota bacterium]
MFRKAIRFLFFLSVSVFLFSCDKNVVFEKNISIPDYKWEMNNTLRLEAEISDTVSPHNIYINVRNGSGYEFSNLFLFMTTVTPKGMVAHDTLELTLADVRGKWLGSGSGDVWDNRILFKSNFKFPEVGLWHFDLQQAMRINPLQNVMDAGMRIERAK